MSLTLTWHSASATHVGRVRSINEDSYLERPDIGLWAVADGMGGHEAGDVASRTVIEELTRVPAPISREAVIGNIEQRLHTANERLLDYAARLEEGGIVGSTVVVLACHAGTALCFWAGDSRIYRYRDGALQRLTQDHSQVQELVRLGLIDRAEAETHPLSNVVTRAVGVAEALNLDTESHELGPGDVFLLCSDGLTAHIRDEEIAAVLAAVAESRTPGVCRTAADGLLERTLEQGARDNVTLVIVQVRQAR